MNRKHESTSRRAAVVAVALLAALAWPAAVSAADEPATPAAAEQRRVGQTAALLYKRAGAKIDQGNFEAAQALLEKALAKQAESGIFSSGVMTEPYYPHYLLGVVHMELEQYDVAIQEFMLEDQQGQIQHDTDLYDALKLRLARARRTDNQSPVVQVARSEVLESLLEADREVADVEFHGVIVDSGGVGSLTIDGHEINFRQDADGFAFDETLRLDPVKPEVELVVTDIAGNLSRQMIPVDLPPLYLGEAVSGVHAVIVGVNHYRTWVEGQPGECPASANACDDAERFHCYHLADLNAAAQDAERVYDFLLRRGVPPENLTLLVSHGETDDATHARVEAALAELENKQGDTAIFFFAGHGVNSRRQKNLMLLSDTRQWECGDAPPERQTDLEQSAIGVDQVERALMKGRFEERYVVVDACRAPRMASTRGLEQEEVPEGFSARGLRLVSETPDVETYGLEPVVFYATFDRSVSVEWNVRQAGYFTWFLLQGLRRDLPLWDLKTFVQENVQRRTRTDHGLTQKPHVVLPEKLENDYALQKRTRILGRARPAR